MTKEGAEIVKGALKVILEQCRATKSCENCPVYDCCDNVFDCIPEFRRFK